MRQREPLYGPFRSSNFILKGANWTIRRFAVILVLADA